MKRPAWLTPTLIDVLLVPVALADSLLYIYETSTLEITIAIVSSLSLLLRRRWPWVTLLLTLPALVVTASSITGLVALYSVAVAARRRWTIFVAGAAVLLCTSAIWWGIGLGGDMVVLMIYAVMTTAAPIALGLLVRTRRELTERLRELEEARESERRRADEEVLATERARIAREMHDVVSHQVSLLAVQAGALQVASVDPEVKETARTLRSLAVKTLDELRQMVTVLRAASATTNQIAPQPTIADLPELIAGSGIAATTSLAFPAELSTSVQRAVYRTVQEALTNIRKHAAGATATITAHTVGSELVVRVHNTAGTEAAMTLPASGHGLVGLRERAELLGGSLTTVAEGDGTFAVQLRIPTA